MEKQNLKYINCLRPKGLKLHPVVAALVPILLFYS